MVQTDSPNPIVRERWWEYRSQMEHPPEIEGSSIYRVPFVRVSYQSESWSLRRPNPTARGEKQLARRCFPAIVSLAVHIVSRGGCLPPRNRRGLPPSPIVGQVVNCQEELRVVSICRLWIVFCVVYFESTFRYECLLNFRFAVLSIWSILWILEIYF